MDPINNGSHERWINLLYTTSRKPLKRSGVTRLRPTPVAIDASIPSRDLNRSYCPSSSTNNRGSLIPTPQLPASSTVPLTREGWPRGSTNVANLSSIEYPLLPRSVTLHPRGAPSRRLKAATDLRAMVGSPL